MLRTNEEEAADREDEAKFWHEYSGKTECFGTVAKLVLLMAIIVQAIFNSWI